MVASYAEYIGLCAGTSPQEQSSSSLDRFAMRRFLNERVGHLQSPSDKRYVDYFAGLLSGVIQVNSSPLYLDQVLNHVDAVQFLLLGLRVNSKNVKFVKFNEIPLPLGIIQVVFMNPVTFEVSQ